MTFIGPVVDQKPVAVTGSHGSLPGQTQQALLLEDEAAADEDAGADSQGQADVEVVLAAVLSHSEAGCAAVAVVFLLCHIDNQAVKKSLQARGAAQVEPHAWRREGGEQQHKVGVQTFFKLD